MNNDVLNTEELKDAMVLLEESLGTKLFMASNKTIKSDRIMAKLKHMKATQPVKQSTNSKKIESTESTNSTECSESAAIETQYVPSEVFSFKKTDTNTESHMNLAFTEKTNSNDSAKIINIVLSNQSAN